MSNFKRTVIYLRGTAHYAKILGEPRLNYNKDGKEWTIDIALTPAGERQLADAGVKDRIKSKESYLKGSPYITLKQRELRADGSRNDPPNVSDIRGAPWDTKTLIGNGSDVDVRIEVVDYGPGKKKGMYLRSVRVLRLVPYERSDFPEINEEDEFFAAAQEAEKSDGFVERFVNGDKFEVDPDDALDDDIPGA